jgi:hypothetical protein
MKKIGRPPKSPDERRSETFLIRLTKDEARTLKQASRQLGFSAGEILRQGGLSFIRQMEKLQAKKAVRRGRGAA